MKKNLTSILIAILLLIDLGATFLREELGLINLVYLILLVLGNMALPLVCMEFVIQAKRSNPKKMLLSLFILAVVSEVPYDILRTIEWVKWSCQSLMLTLLEGCLLLIILHLWIFNESNWRETIKTPDGCLVQREDKVTKIGLFVFKYTIIFLFGLIAYVTRAEGDYKAILMIVIFDWVVRTKKRYSYLPVVGVMIFYVISSGNILNLFTLFALIPMFYMLRRQRYSEIKAVLSEQERKEDTTKFKALKKAYYPLCEVGLIIFRLLL